MLAQKIFHQLSRYVQKNLPGTFHYTTKETQDENGLVWYDVELSQYDAVHHLKFNEAGDLVDVEVKAAFLEEMEIEI